MSELIEVVLFTTVTTIFYSIAATALRRGEINPHTAQRVLRLQIET